MKRSDSHATSLLLQRHSRALERHLPSAVKGDDHAVHQARVASRRLREAVPVLSKGLKGSKSRKAQRKMRRLTRALGMVRELDVALGQVDELGRRSDIPRQATDELRAHVLAERQRRRDDMLKALDAINTAKLGRRLECVAAAVDGAEALEWRQVLGKRLLRRAKRLGTTVEAAGQLYSPERLHDVRIAVKKLRYAMELASSGGATTAAPLVRRLKRAQDLLGRLQDLQVLHSHVKALQAAGGARTPHEGLDMITRRIDDESRRLHARFVAVSPSLIELATDIRRLIVPQVLRAGRTRPLKMPLARAAAARAASRR